MKNKTTLADYPYCSKSVPQIVCSTWYVYFLGGIPIVHVAFHIPYFRFIAAHPGEAACTTPTKRSMSCSGMRLMSMLFQYRDMTKTMSCASRSKPRLSGIRPRWSTQYGTRSSHHPRVQFCPHEFRGGQERHSTDKRHRECIEAAWTSLASCQNFDLTATRTAKRSA
jgi:hypothetical protein